MGCCAGAASLAGERQHLVIRGLALLSVAPTVRASVGPARLCGREDEEMKQAEAESKTDALEHREGRRKVISATSVCSLLAMCKNG